MDLNTWDYVYSNTNQWSPVPSSSLDIIKPEADYCVYVEILTTNIAYKLEKAFGSNTIRFRGEDHIVVHCNEETLVKICSEHDYILKYELYKDFIRIAE
jgi:hypothetical protein